MGSFTGLTAERMRVIEAASVVDGDVVGSNLILTKKDNTTIDAGNVRGPAGVDGPAGEAGPEGPVGPTGANGSTTILANTRSASYTAILEDAGKCIEMNAAAATVFTIPPNSDVVFPIGTVIEIARIGAGVVTIAKGTLVVLRNRLDTAGTSNRTIANQWSSASIRKRATDEWVLIGDIL